MKHIIIKLGQKITPSIVEQIRKETAKEIFAELEKVFPNREEVLDIQYQKLKAKFGVKGGTK